MKYDVPFIILLCLPTLASGADWAQFRGPQGRSAAVDVPVTSTEWTGDLAIAWRADLPGTGPSSPIVVGDRVFVTCSSGYDQNRMHVLCFDKKTGERQWERQFWATGRTKSHPVSGNAAPTPTSDGEAIYAFFSSNDLACLDLDGNLRWYRGLAYDFPKAGNDVGMSSSPVVADQTVVVQVENQGDSFVAAIDTSNGETRWQIERPRLANWSSPLIMQSPQGQLIVLIKSSDGLDAHDLRRGRLLWTFPGDAGGIPSVATLPGQIYLPVNGITALDLPSDGNAPQVRWSSNRMNPGPASPIVSDEHIYAVNRAGVLTCADLANGDILWKLRLKGSFWATPVLVGKHMFCINDAGLGQIVDVTGKGKIIGTHDLGESVQGSPAVSQGAVYVRSAKSLWKIAATP